MDPNGSSYPAMNQGPPPAGYQAVQPMRVWATPQEKQWDILAPPTYNGLGGQLIHWSATSNFMTEKFAIFGTDSQVVQIMLMPNEAVISVPGAMMYRGFNVKMRTGFDGCCSGCQRVMAGEPFFRNMYTNHGSAPECITLTPNFPSKVIPVDLARSGNVLAHPGLYMGHVGDVRVTFRMVRSLSTGCCAGNGFFLLNLQGSGTVFMMGGGTIMEKILSPGEQLLVDTHSIVGFSETVHYDIKFTGNCMTMCCGGEGFFNDILIGPGLVITQSMSKERLMKALGQATMSSKSQQQQQMNTNGVQVTM